MKRYRLNELPDAGNGHILADVIAGRYLTGGLGFKSPGQRTHETIGPDGTDRHVHEDCEVFIILQGRGVMDVDDQAHPIGPGDVLVIEPGEDHHLTADTEDPCVNLWLHAGPERHKG